MHRYPWNSFAGRFALQWCSTGPFALWTIPARNFDRFRVFHPKRMNTHTSRLWPLCAFPRGGRGSARPRNGRSENGRSVATSRFRAPGFLFGFSSAHAWVKTENALHPGVSSRSRSTMRPGRSHSIPRDQHLSGVVENALGIPGKSENSVFPFPDRIPRRTCGPFCGGSGSSGQSGGLRRFGSDGGLFIGLLLFKFSAENFIKISTHWTSLAFPPCFLSLLAFRHLAKMVDAPSHLAAGGRIGLMSLTQAATAQSAGSGWPGPTSPSKTEA